MKSAEINADSEFQEYVRTLGASSSRVRIVMLAVAVASVAALATLWGEQDDGWASGRLKKATEYRKIANDCKLWDSYNLRRAKSCWHEIQGVGFQISEAEKNNIVRNFGFVSPRCVNACDAAGWIASYGIYNDGAAREFSEKQHESFVENVLYVKMPVLGLTFDINDLGLITGVAFLVLMLAMFYCTHRAHENLYLAMWKVRNVSREGPLNDPGSPANLLYHGLAMEQVFTVPPTLARWNDSKLFRKASYTLFILPAVVQFLVLRGDWSSADLASLFSEGQTTKSLVGQIILLVSVATLGLLCCAHVSADDKEWSATFFFINPIYRMKLKPKWRYWVRLARHSVPGWGLVGKKGADGALTLFFSDTVRDRVWQLEHFDTLGHVRLSLCRKSRSYALHLDSCERLRGSHRPRSGRDTSHQPWIQGDGDLRLNLQVNPDAHYYVEDSIGNQYFVLRDKIEKRSSRGDLIWALGGLRYQADDGKDGCVGFARIRAAVLDANGGLVVTDGAWVRRISPEGKVVTLGGKPLGKIPRPERPSVLGIGIAGEDLIVCDYSLRRLHRISENGLVSDFYSSAPGWAPSGVWVDGGSVFVLEYRVDTLLRLVSKVIGSYLRLRKLNLSNPDEGQEVFGLSLIRARRAESKRNGIVLGSAKPSATSSVEKGVDPPLADRQ